MLLAYQLTIQGSHRSREIPFMPFLCIGHRGASGHAPENTLKAFEKAVEMGCSWVELDVHVVENQLLVIHDDELERTTNGRGPVPGASFDYLRSLDAGDGQQIPTLIEVIDLIDHRSKINIELKGRDIALPVNELLRELCLSGWQHEEFLISSFDHEELARADLAFRRGALFGRHVEDCVTKARQLQAYSINLSLKVIDADIVKKAHACGLKVLVYTVNHRDEMQRLKSLGVDGVFTNYPDRFPRVDGNTDQ